MDGDLHYQTGKMGKVARFYVARRAGGDPYEETVILPALIITASLQLYGVKHFADWILFGVFVIADVGAGVWAGVCLGYFKLLKIVLRVVSVSILEAALLSALNDDMSRSEAVKTAVTLWGINLSLFVFGHVIGSTFGGIALVTEKQWQVGVLRRAKMYKVYRIVFGAEKLEGADDNIVIAVWLVKCVIPFLAMGCVAWALGVDPKLYIQKFLGMTK